MKKMMMVAAAAATLGLFADGAYEFVTKDGGNGYGYSYIKINQNLDSFSFKSDWHSLGNAGQVGYVVYTSDMSDEQMASYMEQNSHPPTPEFQKSINDGVVNLGSLKAGDRVGFYEVRPNEGIYTMSAFKDWKGETWLAFDKNDGTGKDEWMTITAVSAVPANNGPTGAPLPGVLAVLLVGGLGAGTMKLRKRKRA
ncbi:MAG: hypothetical protein IIZ06_09150 [Kiritimatiellae bacterium]|nr:hypothetical protein [Kiritimatiellia bacterium]